MLTDLQRKKLPNLFNLHDTDRDGRIRQADYDQVAQDLARGRGMAADSPEAQELRSRFATAWDSMSEFADADGLSLDGWLAYWDRVISTDGMYEKVLSPIGEFVFSMLDRDGSGSVNAQEYIMFYKVMSFEEDEAREVFQQLDSDGSGSLSREEILAMLEQYFLSDDPAAPGNRFFGPYE